MSIFFIYILISYYLVVLLMKLNRCIYRFACIKLEEYHTAKVALEKGASFAPNESRFTNLIQECDRYIAGQHIFLCLLEHLYNITLFNGLCYLIFISHFCMLICGD